MLRATSIAVLVALAVPACAWSRIVNRYLARAGDVRLEISAPRADIIRVRAGRGALPEDASWAVLPEARAHRTPMSVTEDPKTARIETAALVITLDRRRLAMTIRNRAGWTVLDDAPGEALRFGGADWGVRKVLPPGMHYFGLGDRTGRLDRRGQAFTFWNTDAYAYGPTTDPLYKTIPFLIGLDGRGHAMGLFVDSTWRSWLDLGKRERKAFAFGAEGGGVDYYVMADESPKAIVRAYAWLTGAAPLAPMWSLGFQQSHWGYLTQSEVKAVADRLRSDRLPADVVWLDIDYQDRNRPFTVNTRAFPDLAGLVSELADEDLRVVAITDLHISDAPGQGYEPFDSGLARGVFLRRPDGSLYVGDVWPGPSVFPDFSRRSVRAWWGEQYAAFVRMGVAGFWNDMNEPAIFGTPTKTMPLDIVHHIEEPGFASRAASHAEMHNVYGQLNSRATFEGLLKLAPDRRPFVMTRASYAGGQRYAATWTGDNVSTWESLSLSTMQIVSLGLSGFAYAGADIGGFAGAQPSAKLLTRWFEVGAFYPIFRDHYQKGKPAQEPWVGGPVQEAIRRRYIEMRYRLMPYLYTLAEENSRTGLPIMRPVFLEYPAVVAAGPHLGGSESEFMLGRDLLIAPPVAWDSPAPQTVSLPTAGWYDFWTGVRLAGDRAAETPSLERLPVFVRPGAILPRQPLVQSTMQTPQGPLELDVYAGPDCRGVLYLDDGVTLAYRRGDFLRQAFRCDAHHLTLRPREGRYPPWWRKIAVVLHGWSDPPRRVRIGGRTLPTAVDPQNRTARFVIPDAPSGVQVILR